MKATGQDNGKFIHGHNGASGKSRTYTSWDMMRQRCLNPNHARRYSYYGGRGIRVCRRWAKFSNFLADMGERPANTSLDRKNPNGNYSPSNCRWGTRRQQVEGKRSSVWVEINGERLILKEWSRRLGVIYETLRHRYKVGTWPA
jgi:hypothetical protein